MAYTKTQMLELTPDLVDLAKTTESIVFFSPTRREISEKENMQNEYDLLGYFVTRHPLDDYKVKMKQLDDTSSLREKETGSKVHAGGIISSVKVVTTKAGKKMAFLQLEDNHGRVEVVIFSKMYEKYERLLQKNTLVEIKGRLEIDEKEVNGEEVRNPKIIASFLFPLENVKQLSEIHLRLTSKDDFHKVKSVLHGRRGDVDVYIDYDGFLLETNYQIPQTVDIMNELKNLCLIKEVEK